MRSSDLAVHQNKSITIINHHSSPFITNAGGLICLSQTLVVSYVFQGNRCNLPLNGRRTSEVFRQVSIAMQLFLVFDGSSNSVIPISTTSYEVAGQLGGVVNLKEMRHRLLPISVSLVPRCPSIYIP